MTEASYRYGNGLPFSTQVKLNIDAIKTRITQNKPAVIIIDGLSGEGKTTLAYEVAEYFTGKPINLPDQLGMGGALFQAKLKICRDKKHLAVIYDEAGDFSKRRAITFFNQMLLRVFQTFRTYKILVIICLPNVGILDGELFSMGIPRLLLNCHDRTMTYGNIRGYGLHEMMWLRHHMSKEVVPTNAYTKVTPNFRGHFLNLPPAEERKLDLFCTRGKDKILNKQLMVAQGLISIKEISKKMNLSARWVHDTIKELEIEAQDQLDGDDYYDKDVIFRLLESVKRPGRVPEEIKAEFKKKVSE